METYKTFKGLIYLLLISALTVFLVLSFKSSPEDKIPVTNTPEYRALEHQKDSINYKLGISEYARTLLELQAQEDLSKEQQIYNNQTIRQKQIKQMTPSQTDELFLKLNTPIK